MNIEADLDRDTSEDTAQWRVGDVSRHAAPADPVAELLGSVVEELREQLAVVSVRRQELEAGGFDAELAKAAATLGKALTGCLAEVRQRERHAARERAGLKLDRVMDFLRGITVEQRLHVLRELAATVDDETRSVL